MTNPDTLNKDALEAARPEIDERAFRRAADVWCYHPENEGEGYPNLVCLEAAIRAYMAALPDPTPAVREAIEKIELIAAMKGQTLVSVEYGRPYSVGANAAFEDCAALATEALTALKRLSS